LRARVQGSPYRFDDPAALARSLEGITTLYNTYDQTLDGKLSRAATAAVLRA
jgi:hypothetical protein